MASKDDSESFLELFEHATAVWRCPERNELCDFCLCYGGSPDCQPAAATMDAVYSSIKWAVMQHKSQSSEEHCPILLVAASPRDWPPMSPVVEVRGVGHRTNHRAGGTWAVQHLTPEKYASGGEPASFCPHRHLFMPLPPHNSTDLLSKIICHHCLGPWSVNYLKFE
ncbi:uncharacterized [Tachysurus ichikawai]